MDRASTLTQIQPESRSLSSSRSTINIYSANPPPSRLAGYTSSDHPFQGRIPGQLGGIAQPRQFPFTDRSESASPPLIKVSTSGVAGGLLASTQKAQPSVKRTEYRAFTKPNQSLTFVLCSEAATSPSLKDDLVPYDVTAPPHGYDPVESPDSTTSSEQEDLADSPEPDIQLITRSPTPCSICQRSTIPSSNPMSEYLVFKSINNIPGLRCPDGHICCIYCLRSQVLAAMSPSSKKKQSPIGCFKFTDISLDMMYRLFLPQEVAIWHWTRPSDENSSETTASSKPIPAHLSEIFQDKSDKGHTSNPKDSKPASTCGICLDQFLAVENPLEQSKSRKAGKAALPFGLALPCPRKHEYCLGCIGQHINTELEKGSDAKPVFPMRCPECPTNSWGITDDVAQRVLSPKVLEAWYFQKLRDSTEKMHCPHANCSALVEVPKHGLRDATCPACQRMICVKCQVPWHMGLTCAEYKENNSQDQLLRDLAKRSGWRRCPQCRMFVERSSGCPHMTCRCGTHFCYKCGSAYVRGSCPLGSGCRAIPDPPPPPPPPIITQPAVYRPSRNARNRYAMVIPAHLQLPSVPENPGRPPPFNQILSAS